MRSMIAQRVELVKDNRFKTVLFIFWFVWFYIVPPNYMVLSFSIGTFLTNYDVTDRKLY